jgi:hypothetical protein
MKKLFILLLAVATFTSCDKKTQPEPEPWQEYTSFVVHINNDNDFRNCLAAYRTSDGIFVKLADLGSLTQNKLSKEVILSEDDPKDIYIYWDLYGIDGKFGQRARTTNPFSLTQKKKYILTIDVNTKVTTVWTNNPAEYPQN